MPQALSSFLIKPCWIGLSSRQAPLEDPFLVTRACAWQRWGTTNSAWNSWWNCIRLRCLDDRPALRPRTCGERILQFLDLAQTDLAEQFRKKRPATSRKECNEEAYPRNVNHFSVACSKRKRRRKCWGMHQVLFIKINKYLFKSTCCV